LTAPGAVRHDPGRHRFVLSLPEGDAVLEYHPRPGVMDILSTVVPEAARGHGAGGRLVVAALDHARSQGWRVIPSCWFVRTWVGDHPEYQDLLGDD
jgi:predicted GNAT family acetyltransferase